MIIYAMTAYMRDFIDISSVVCFQKSTMSPILIASIPRTQPRWIDAPMDNHDMRNAVTGATGASMPKRENGSSCIAL